MGIISFLMEWLLTWYRCFTLTYLLVRGAITLILYNLFPKPIHKVFQRNVAKFPKKACIVDAGSGYTLTFQQVWNLSNQIGAWASASGVKKGSVVALVMENRCEYVPFWLGVMKAGGCTALINTGTKGESLAHAINISGASIVVAGPEFIQEIENLKKVESTSALLLANKPKFFVYNGESDEKYATPSKEWESLDRILPSCSLADLPSLKQFTTRDVALLIYTSGTTGMPKAARITHLRLRQLIELGNIMGIKPKDVTYCALPLYHTAGGCMSVGYMLNIGTTLVVRKKFTRSGFWSDCSKYNATVIQYIGELCRYLCNGEVGEFDQKHKVRLAVGNGLRPDVWDTFKQRFNVGRIAEFYGSTEGNVAMYNCFGESHAIGYFPIFPWPFTYFSPARCRLFPVQFVKYDPATEEPYRDPATGRGKLADLNEVAEAIAQVTTGRDLIGLKRFEGYLDSKATEKKLVRDLFKSGDMYFRSGDLLRMDERGFVYFVDRVGDTFRWKGENVSTMQVAHPCAKITNVEEANVYGVEIPGADGRAGMAALTLKEGTTIDPMEAFRVLTAELPTFAVPIFLRIMPKMDITGTFKHKKTDLQKEGFDVKDPVYVLNLKGKTYDVLTAETVKRINSKQIQL
eukprot:PhF_6_TR26442/c0_g1_i1/m.38295/K08745/SLC27A1_4, FATP1, FATP4; solute carrier family 27 (fatty acid transporter), member 1/4